MKHRGLCVALAAALGSSAFGVMAGGLGIGTQSGSGTGNAFAGGAAAAEDASTVWYNPAGMTLLPGHGNAAIALHALKPSFKFEDRGSTLPPGTGEGGDGGDWEFVPLAFYSQALTDRLYLGLAFNVPFGLATEYNAGWRGQAIARESELKTFNFNVALAYKLNDVVSVGAGVSYQRAELKFNSVPAAALGLAEVDMDDNSWGANLGVMFQLSKDARIGVHYRSSIKYDLSGRITASPLLGGDSSASGSVRTPENWSISFFTALNPKWDLMADLTWTRWSRLQRLDVLRSSGPLAGGAPFTTLTFDWSDTWRYSVGANYKVNDALKLRFGVAFDETPTNNVDRTPRVPDQDRTWLALGAQYRVSKAGVLDVGYAHEFIRDASVNNAAALGGRLIGQFSSKADILSLQYSHAF
jgi:long-chain fatty acid transport protein